MGGLLAPAPDGRRLAPAGRRPTGRPIDVSTFAGLDALLERRGELLADYSRIEFHRGRNTSVNLARPAGDGIHVKQHPPRAESTFAAERDAHLGLLSPYGDAGSSVAVPRLLESDRASRVLVFDLVPRAESLGARLNRTGRLPGPTMALIGRFVGELHQRTFRPATTARRAEAARAVEVRQLPSYTELDPELYATLSDGERRLARALQGDQTLAKAVDLLADTIEPVCQIHGDLQPENILLRERTRRPAVIDWELTRFSDPAVELGYLAGCLLDRCLSRVRASSPAEWRTRAQGALERLALALRLVWRAYLEVAGALVARRAMLPFLVMSHAGAAAIGQVAGRAHASGELTARDWLILEQAGTLLVDPVSACRRLLTDQAAP